MIRAILGEALLFLLPFAVFALYLAARRRDPLQWAAWSERTGWLVIAGLALALGGFLLVGFTNEGETSGFEPTHMENGRVVPGRFR